MSGIGLIHNPNASRNRGRKGLVERLRKIVGKAGIVEETKYPDALADVAKQFMEANIDILAINGGDGTNHITLSHFLKVYGERGLPPFIHLRGGTMNTVANSLGVIKGSAEKLLQRIVDKYIRNEKFDTAQRNIMKINEKYGFIFGSGLVSNFLDAYYEGGRTSPWKALKVIVKAIISTIARTEYVKRIFKTTRARITIDGEIATLKDWTVILSATIKDIGLGFKPAYRGDSDGTFHMVASDIKPLRVILNFPRLLRGLPVKAERIYDKLSRSASVEPLDGEIRYTIDGELYNTDRRIDIQLGPRLTAIKG